MEPRNGYLEALSVYLRDHFDVADLPRLFGYALKKYDHFPSISQVSDVGMELGITKKSVSKYDEILRNNVCSFCKNQGYYIFESAKGSSCAAGCMRCELGKFLVSENKYGISNMYLAIQQGYFPQRNFPEYLLNNDGWKIGDGFQSLGTHVLSIKMQLEI